MNNERTRPLSLSQAARWGVGIVVTVAISLVVAKSVWGCYPWKELVPGWFAALLNAAGAFLIHREAVRPERQKNPLWGVVANVLRVFVLLGIVVLALEFLDSPGFYVFLVAMMSGYFVFLFGEILRLHTSTLRGREDHE